MEQCVEDFGPIKKAEVDVKPLTVLIGKNCVGKSYFASLLFAVLTILRTKGIEEPDIIFRILSPKDLEEISKDITRELPEQDILAKIVVHSLKKYKEYLESLLKTQLESIFGTEINDLIKLGAPEARIRFGVSPDFLLTVTLSKPNKVMLSFGPEEEKMVSVISNMVRKQSGTMIARELKKLRQLKRPSSAFSRIFNISFMISRALINVVTPKEGPSSV